MAASHNYSLLYYLAYFIYYIIINQNKDFEINFFQTARKDYMYLVLKGLDAVKWKNKDRAECLTRLTPAIKKITEDKNTNWAQCVALDRNLGFQKVQKFSK